MKRKALYLQFCAHPSKLTLISVALGFILVSTSRGELLFSDSFDYPTGLLAGNGPPPGSPPEQGPWIPLLRMPRVTFPGLKFPRIGFTGNAVTLGDDGATGDTASAALRPVGAGGSGVVWLGFLIRQDKASPGLGYAILTFNDGFGPTAPQFGVLYASIGRFGIDNGVVPTERRLSPIFADLSPAWLVVKLNFTTGRELLFINPSKESEPAESLARGRLLMRPEFQASGFDRIVLKEGYSSRNNAFVLDEVRVGTTFADLKP